MRILARRRKGTHRHFPSLPYSSLPVSEFSSAAAGHSNFDWLGRTNHVPVPLPVWWTSYGSLKRIHTMPPPRVLALGYATDRWKLLGPSGREGHVNFQDTQVQCAW
jgi:hypothetical protein